MKRIAATIVFGIVLTGLSACDTVTPSATAATKDKATACTEYKDLSGSYFASVSPHLNTLASEGSDKAAMDAAATTVKERSADLATRLQKLAGETADNAVAAAFRAESQSLDQVGVFLTGITTAENRRRAGLYHSQFPLHSTEKLSRSVCGIETSAIPVLADPLASCTAAKNVIEPIWMSMTRDAAIMVGTDNAAKEPVVQRFAEVLAKADTELQALLTDPNARWVSNTVLSLLQQSIAKYRTDLLSDWKTKPWRTIYGVSGFGSAFTAANTQCGWGYQLS